MHIPSSLTAILLLASSVWAGDNDKDYDMDKSTSPTMMMGTGMTMPMSMSKSTSMTMTMPLSMNKAATISTTTETTVSITIKTLVVTPSTSSTSTASKTTVTTVMAPMFVATSMTTSSKPTTTSTTMMMSMASGMPPMLMGSTIRTTTSITTRTTVSTSMSTGASVSMQVVKVSNANGTLVFTPNSITAAVGSLVQYQFYPMNHSVVRANFQNPCVPIANVMPSTPGLFSGFQPTTGLTTPVYTILINDTMPIWYYCSQGMHCQAGMVGVINPPANQSIAQFAALAKTAPLNLSPGQMMPMMPMMPSGTMPMANTTAKATGSMTSMAPITKQTVSAASGSLVAGKRESWLGVAVAALVAVAGVAVL
ncbi:hypothetical protein MMC19_007263 [Ptychographa xylographoides]|nr:hypothetical protein [Ptychographa xylographoides]